METHNLYKLYGVIDRVTRAHRPARGDVYVYVYVYESGRVGSGACVEQFIQSEMWQISAAVPPGP